MSDVQNGPLPERAVVPHPKRCDPDGPYYAVILDRHRDAMARGRHAYADPATGYFVFTAQYLWDRGLCCDTGCRHCPFIERGT
jgi:hypothetical protein